MVSLLSACLHIGKIVPILLSPCIHLFPPTQLLSIARTPCTQVLCLDHTCPALCGVRCQWDPPDHPYRQRLPQNSSVTAKKKKYTAYNKG